MTGDSFIIVSFLWELWELSCLSFERWGFSRSWAWEFR